MNLKRIFWSLALCVTAFSMTAKTTEYVILTSSKVMADAEWKTVVEALKVSHPQAETVVYTDSIQEALPQLKVLKPRYVAVVDMPEAIGKKFVIDLNKISRKVDDDIFADFIAGIVTGYNAQAAKRMVEDARTPFVMRNTVSTVSDLGKGKWFDNFAYLTDARPSYYYTRPVNATELEEHYVTDSIPNMLTQRYVDRVRKQYGDSSYKYIPKNYNTRKPNTLKPFCDLYDAWSPDVVITASHATENNLEMPFSAGNLLCKDGRIYADFPEGPRYFKPIDHPRVYLPVGNCLIGNMNHTKNSMAAAWINSEHVDCMVGYVVTTWYGRNGWGGLRTFFTQPGRYTVAEAFYLNQQDLLERLRQNAPNLLPLSFPYVQNDDFTYEMKTAYKIAQKRLTDDELGQWYDRDVVVYYGDPAWNVRTKELPDEQDVAVSIQQKGKDAIVTIKTGNNFSQKRMEGGNLPKDNMQPQPFTYFFPQRLKNPKLADGQTWKAALDENFLLLYDTHFEANKTYTVKIKCDK